MTTTKHVKVDIKGLEAVKKKLFDENVEIRTKALIKYAKETLRKAYNESEYKNRTLNLKDSYVWIVFFHGKRIDYGFLTDMSEASVPVYRKGESIEGRKEAEKFIKNYTSTYKGWEVVFAATTIYGAYLETGVNRTKYVVISSIFDDVQRDLGNAKIFQSIQEI